MNVKQMAKKMLKRFDLRINVKWFSDFCLAQNGDDEVEMFYVKHPNTILDEIQIRIEIANREYTIDLLNKNNTHLVSYEFFAIMHEIGHIMTDICDVDNYQEDCQIYEKMFREDLIDEFGYISLYNNIESEANANNWAINWIKDNKILAKTLNNQLNRKESD